MEIERKFLPASIPDDIDTYPNHVIEQAYLCTSPVVRIRRQDNDYILTYKGHGMMVREEYNLPLTKESYEHLLAKADGTVLKKIRYCVPLDAKHLTAELDVFKDAFDGLCLVEVEFPDEKSATQFQPPEWFGEEVTFSSLYHNSSLSKMTGWTKPSQAL